MKKKILFLLMIVLLTLTVVCASDNSTLSVDNKTDASILSSHNQSSSEVVSSLNNSKKLISSSNTTKDSLKEDIKNQVNTSYYVNASRVTDGDGSIENPWKKVTQSVFNNMASGSVLYIANGNYLFNQITISRDVTLIGENRTKTVMQGSFYVKNSNIVISNLSFTSNLNQSILDLEESNITIDSSIFTNNSVLDSEGGAIYAYDTNIIINNSVFMNNSAMMGGAIMICNGSGDGNCIERSHNISIFNSLFTNNSAIYEGGAIYDVYSNLYIKSSNFTNNKARSGGAIYSDDLKLSIVSSRFYNNQAKNLGGALYSNQNKLSLTGNTFLNNNASTGSDLYSQYNQSSVLNKNTWSSNNSIAINSTSYYVNPTIIVTKLNNTNTSLLPSRYDLRDYGYVTSVKNQGSNGNCWAFASIATLESCILKAYNQAYDLSENNMKNIMQIFSQYGTYITPNLGGYDDMSVSYLVNWLGPILESDDEYTLNSEVSPLLDSILHVTNVYSIPKRSNYTDNDFIKEAIMKYGAVFTDIKMVTSGSSSYCSYSAETSHAVSIVGWDDNYSKSNFGVTPPGDGAFIVKNSWGSNSGDNGYYYVSYYDTTILNKCDSVPGGGFTFILNTSEIYDNIYQSDYGGISDWYSVDNNSTYSNEYVITSNEILRAFGTYVEDSSLKYTARIYVNNVLKYTQTGKFTHIGYVTTKLNKDIQVKMNDSVKIELQLVSSTSDTVDIPISNSIYSRLYENNNSLIDNDSYIDAICVLKLYTIQKNSTYVNVKVVDTTFNHTHIEIRVYDSRTNLLKNGTITIMEDNKVTQKFNIKNNVTSTYLVFNSTGEHKIEVYYNNTGCGVSSTRLNINTTLPTTSIRVNTINNTFNHTSIDIKVYDYTNNLLKNGTITIMENNEVIQKINLKSNETLVNLTFSTAGSHVIEVYYDNTGYNPSSKRLYINVIKQDVNIKLYDVSGVIGENITLKALLTNTDGNKISGGNIVFKINGVTLKVDGSFNQTLSPWKFSVSNGLVSVNISATVYIRYAQNLTVTYSGSDCYNSARSNVVAVQIAKRYATLKVTTNTTLANQGTYIKFIVNVSDITPHGTNKTIINDNAYVFFKVNGVTLKDAKGNIITAKVSNNKATYNYYIPTGTYGVCADGKTLLDYNVTAIYNSTDFYPTARNDTTYNVNRSSTTINMISSSINKTSQKLSIKANLRDYNNKLCNSTITYLIKVNGKTLVDASNKTIYYSTKNGVINLSNISIPKANTYSSITIVTTTTRSYISGRTNYTPTVLK